MARAPGTRSRPAARWAATTVLFDDDLHDLSLQGPLAVDFLAKHVAGHPRDLPYFTTCRRPSSRPPVMLAHRLHRRARLRDLLQGGRRPADLGHHRRRGQEMGIMPCSFTALDWLRVESYLLFYPYDNSDMYPMEGEPIGDSLWELDGFTVSPGRRVRGAAPSTTGSGQGASGSSASSCPAAKPPRPGDALYDGDTKVGFVTCGM